MPQTPDWIRRARDQWRYRGQQRPPFAEPVGEGQESVWDYPRPPRVEVDTREVVVRYADTQIARTTEAIRVLETASPPTYYLPPDGVRRELLVASAGASLCEWKGQARYWSLALPGGQRLNNVAWSYDEPFEGFVSIAGYLSFYPARVECFVDGQHVQPQPGTLYGGWVTSEVVGPFKGQPGTESW